MYAVICVIYVICWYGGRPSSGLSFSFTSYLMLSLNIQQL